MQGNASDMECLSPESYVYNSVGKKLDWTLKNFVYHGESLDFIPLTVGYPSTMLTNRHKRQTT